MRSRVQVSLSLQHGTSDYRGAFFVVDMAKKIDKTNAARLLDKAKIAYDLVPYTVDESDLAATHVAEELGEDIADQSENPVGNEKIMQK